MGQLLPKSPAALEQLLRDCAQAIDYWKRAHQRSEFYIQTVKAMYEGTPIADHLAGRLPEIVVDRELTLATPISELLLLHLDGGAIAGVQADMTAAAALMERFSEEPDPKLAIQREIGAHEQMSQAMLSMIDQLTSLRHKVLRALEPSSADGKNGRQKEKALRARKRACLRASFGALTRGRLGAVENGDRRGVCARSQDRRRNSRIAAQEGPPTPRLPKTLAVRADASRDNRGLSCSDSSKSLEESRMVAKQLLSVAQFAERAGVCVKTVYRLIRAGKIPAWRIGGQWRISEAVLSGPLPGPTSPPVAAGGTAAHVPALADGPAGEREASKVVPGPKPRWLRGRNP